MKDLKPRRTWARIAIALGYLGAITLIVGWSLPEGAPTGHRTNLAMHLPDTGVSGATAASADLTPMTGRTRSKLNCAGCGVVESVRTIESRDAFTAGCDAAQFGMPHANGKFFAVGGRDDVESLADIVAATTASEHGVKKVAFATRHQIVVRLRDGTRHVFDEATPRTFRVGDRINVIAVAAGRPAERMLDRQPATKPCYGSARAPASDAAVARRQL